MKSFEEIYNSIKTKFYNLTRIDVASGTVIDMFIKAVADSLRLVYEDIEANKQPYVFTKQTGEELDSTGYFLQCPRLSNESDDNYRYRLMKWTQRNASNNIEAINEGIRKLTFSSSASYIPNTNGIGTATVYLIPYQYTEDYIKNAKNEAEEILSKVISPTTIVEYTVPKSIAVKLVCYLDVKEGADSAYIKNIANELIKDYINNIAPGDKLMLGYINNIILDIEGVEYFNVVQIYLNDEESTSFEILQTVSSKMLFDQIIWWEVKE